MRKSISSWIAFSLSIAAFIAAAMVTQQVFQGLPHLEDEYAYIWQAETAARGDLAVSTPVCPKCFLVPFVVDHDGLRFGKYPPGWPAALSIGILLDLRDWVNPFLAALCVWLTYRLVKRILTEKAALLAAFLTVLSPFFLVNAGSLLSHVWAYFLTLAFILSWLDLTRPDGKLPGWLFSTVSGLSLGLLILTRPLTAAAVSFPFFLHGFYLLIKSNNTIRLHILLTGLLAGTLALIIPLWQYAVTGDPLQNPYTLWWPYDRLGFGPSIGNQAGGNNLWWAWFNMKTSLIAGASDQFGWPQISWIFLPIGLVAVRHNRPALLVSTILPCLLLAYTLYWIGSWVYGPRYYFEGMITSVLLTTAGIQWLAGSLPPRLASSSRKNPLPLRFISISAVVVILIGINFRFYLPQRLKQMTNLYDVQAAQLAPFQSETALDLTPALVIVHQRKTWREYGTLLELSNPYLDTPFIFIYSRQPEDDQAVISAFPQRQVIHYYADEPYKFYTRPRSNQ